MNAVSTWGIGLAATIGVIAGQLIFPFAFDFISTLGVFGLGVWVGKAGK